MAKLSAHGTEIGRIEFVAYRKAYFSDGAILKDSGFGWKLHAKVKAGIDPAQAFENAKSKAAAFLRQRPAFAEYRRFIHSLAPLSRRWKLITALHAMPDDTDGIHSECCNGHYDDIDADLDDIVKLCELYRAACKEYDRVYLDRSMRKAANTEA
jgi:hypothetical protein